MKKAMSGKNYRRIIDLKHPGLGKKAMITSLRGPETRAKYNE